MPLLLCQCGGLSSEPLLGLEISDVCPKIMKSSPMTTDMAAIKRKLLGNFVENIEKKHRQDVIEAIDFLFQGF